MNDDERIDSLMPGIVEGLGLCLRCPIGRKTERGMNLSGRQAIHEVLDGFVSVLFPGCHGLRPVPEKDLAAALGRTLKDASAALREQVRKALECDASDGRCGGRAEACAEKAAAAVSRLVESLPRIQETLRRDINAAYEGDPAARSVMEVVMSYPGVYAIIVHRIAHVLYREGVPLIPRVMSEHAHALTGIDIHPGARIGGGFFVDHGTGVVIGETCVIGENVKLYQGVTLGALSFEKDAQGRLVKGVKRHPNVGDNVIIYAGATILGGDTEIGSGSVIGGNVWLTHSVPPESRVYNRQPEPLIRREGDVSA